MFDFLDMKFELPRISMATFLTFLVLGTVFMTAFSLETKAQPHSLVYTRTELINLRDTAAGKLPRDYEDFPPKVKPR